MNLRNHSAKLRLHPHSRGTRARGFTLIETALALLAIGLGLIGIFGLGRHGLAAAHETDSDRKCAQLANAIFATLREYNARFVDESRTNSLNQSVAWAKKWSESVGEIPFPPVAGMCTNEALRLNCKGDFTAAFDRSAISLLDWNPYYQLQLAIPNDNADSSVAAGPSRIPVLLAIYPDGTTYSSEIRTFATSLINPGGLP